MKKSILLCLTLMICCFIAGGLYIVGSIRAGTQRLETIISLQHVELFRKELAHNIKTVQSALLLQNSPHAISSRQNIDNIETMEESAELCFNCHHNEYTTKKLTDLLQSTRHYMQLLSRAITIRANSERQKQASSEAFSLGEALVAKVESLSIASADKISTRIDLIQQKIKATNYFLMVCIILGPIAILIITFYFLKRFSGSIDALVDAAQSLGAGDYSYRITAPLKDEFNTVANAFNSMVDAINAERQNFESVRTLYQALFESAGDAIMITGLDGDAQGRIISANRAASDLYGYSSNELLGMSILNLVPENKQDSFKEKMKLVQQGEWLHLRARRTQKNGDTIPVDLSLGLLQLDNQRFMLSFCKDISKMQQAEEELQRANQMAIVGQMSAGLAHEIKNPLAGIKVSLDVLSDELDLDADDKEVFVRVINEINRMERLLKSLLNYARPPVPQFDLVDINRLVESSIQNVAVTTDTSKKIEFSIKLSSDLRMVEADSAQLQQVLLNIYLNAMDAMETSGTIITTTQMENDEQIRIQIADTGKGLPPESLEKIFTPFFTTKSKGTGLGLAICKRLIEQHGGNIEVQSRLGEGSSFIIHLPLMQKNRE